MTHEQVDDEIEWTINNQQPVHEGGETEEPSRRHEVLAFIIGLADDELSHVDDEAGEVTQEEHDDDTNQNCCKINFIMWGTVPVTSNMSISIKRLFHFRNLISTKLCRIYLIPLKIAVLK